MDSEFWDEFSRKAKAFESTRLYQDNCWRIYKENKALILQLIKWRDFFGISPGTSEDGGIAYLIFKLHQKHTIKWKSLLNRMMFEARKYPSGLFQTYLSTHIDTFHLEDQEADLEAAKNGKETHLQTSRETREWAIGFTKEMLSTYPRYLREGRVVRCTGPPVEYMPDWYFVARPENEFYREEHLEAALRPLFDKEIANDYAEVAFINNLHEQLIKHAWNNGSFRKILNLLKEYGKRTLLEIEKRAELKKLFDLDRAPNKQLEITAISRKKTRLAEKVKENLKEVVISNKEAQDKVTALMEELLKQKNIEEPTY